MTAATERQPGRREMSAAAGRREPGGRVVGALAGVARVMLCVLAALVLVKVFT